MTTLAHIADRVLNRPLMIAPDKLAIIASVLEGRIEIDAAALAVETNGTAPEASRFAGRKSPEGRKPYAVLNGGAACIPVIGSLVNRGAWLNAASGMTSYEGLKFQIAQAAADSDVRSIVLDMDSPGGEAVGAFEAADVVRQAAAKKPVVAVINGMAASAAYAIASAATKIVINPSGIAGSIGVVMLHADYSRRLDSKGITPTLIHAGARKVDGNPYQPLTAEVTADLRAEVEKFYGMFCACVGAGRGAKLSAAGAKATEARTFIGADAVSAGLVDEVGTFEAVLAGSVSQHGDTRTIRAAYSPNEVAAVINEKLAPLKPEPAQVFGNTTSGQSASTPEEVAERINRANRRFGRTGL